MIPITVPTQREAFVEVPASFNYRGKKRVGVIVILTNAAHDYASAQVGGGFIGGDCCFTTTPMIPRFFSVPANKNSGFLIKRIRPAEILNCI